MNSIEYWEKRKAKRMFEYMGLSEDTALEIAKLYRKASMYTTQEMTQIFNRYKTKFGLSEAEARRILNTLKDPNSLDELRKVLRNKEQTAERKEALELLEAPAYRARINRFQKLQENIDSVMKNVYGQEKDFSTSHYIDLGYDAYYKSMFDIQKHVGLGFNFTQLNARDFDTLLNSNWSGSNYSQRIWENTEELAQRVKEELLVSLLTGRTERETAAIIQNEFDVGAYKARRLIRTESAFVAEEMEAKSYEECGAEKYRFLAVLDLKTSEICRAKDNQVFELFKRKTGVNYPPLHPWCRSTTCIYIDDETLEHMTRIAQDPITGKNIKVPANMSYKEWCKKYVPESFTPEQLKGMYKNISADEIQYSNYRNVLGDEYVPKTRDEFLAIKYDKNNPSKWMDLKAKYRTVNRYKVDYGEVKVSKILELDRIALNSKNSFTKSNFRKNGNVGVLQYDGKTKVAFSKMNEVTNESYAKFTGDKDNVILLSSNQHYKTAKKGDVVDGKPTKGPRCVDSEAKFFEYMRELHPNKEDAFEFTILSERNMCESCRNVKDQFQNEYKNAKINIVSGKKVVRHKKQQNGTVKEVEASPWDWRKR